MKRQLLCGFVLIAAIVARYYVHITTAGWVYEDVTFWHMPLFGLFTRYPSNHLAALTFALSPEDSRWAHAVNVAFHCANVLLLVALVTRWGGFGWTTGWLFAFLPLTSEAVAYAAGRSELMGATAILGALWFATASRGAPRERWLGLAFCLFACATTKPTAIAIILPLIGWAWMTILPVRYDPKLRRGKTALLCCVPLIIACIWVVLHRSQNVPASVPHLRWFAVQAAGTWWLLFSVFDVTGHFFPLAINHPWWLFPTSLQVLAAVTLVLVVVAIVVWSGKWMPLITFGIGFWLIAWMPRLFVRETLGWLHEKHAYVPALGICIALAELLMMAMRPADVLDYPLLFMEHKASTERLQHT